MATEDAFIEAATISSAHVFKLLTLCSDEFGRKEFNLLYSVASSV